jgi:hypothetical protein
MLVLIRRCVFGAKGELKDAATHHCGAGGTFGFVGGGGD